MAGKTLDEIIKLKDDAQRRMTEAMGSVAKGTKIDPDAALKELDRMIAQQGERMEATKVAMASTVSRFEAEIKLRETRISELKKQQEQYNKGGGRPLGTVKLQDIKGINAAAEERLRAKGIKDVQALSEASAERIAEILEVNEDKAADILKRAKKLMKR